MSVPILGDFKLVNLVKLVEWRADIGNFSFKLLNLTSSLLVFCSIISTGHKHFGSPIHCNLDSEAKVSLAAFQSFCFMEGTYTLLVDQATMANTSTLHHGLGHGLGKDDPGSFHQNYYIW